MTAPQRNRVLGAATMNPLGRTCSRSPTAILTAALKHVYDSARHPRPWTRGAPTHSTPRTTDLSVSFSLTASIHAEATVTLLVST